MSDLIFPAENHGKDSGRMDFRRREPLSGHLSTPALKAPLMRRAALVLQFTLHQFFQLDCYLLASQQFSDDPSMITPCKSLKKW
jgi:hypothetical protein